MTDKKTLAELVSDLTPEELRVFDVMLREAANEIHDFLMKERKREAKRLEGKKDASIRASRRRYYLKNQEKIKAARRRRYHKNKQVTAAT